jgi:hypothetical protein
VETNELIKATKKKEVGRQPDLLPSSLCSNDKPTTTTSRLQTTLQDFPQIREIFAHFGSSLSLDLKEGSLIRTWWLKREGGSNVHTIGEKQCVTR